MTAACLALLSLLTIGLRVPALHWGLPSETKTLSTYHPDEATNFFVMQQWNPGKLQVHPQKALWWGTVHLYSLAAVMKAATLTGVVKVGSRQFYTDHLDQADRLYLVARSLSVFWAVVTVWVAFWAGRRVYGTREGLLAAALTAIVPIQVPATIYAKVDCMMVFWGLAIIGLSIPLLSGETKSARWAGLAAGLAAATKYSAGLTIFLPLTALALAHHRGIRAYAEVIGFSALGFVVGCPFAVLDFPIFWQYFQWNILAARTGGPFGIGYAPWFLEYVRFFFPYGLGLPLTVTLLASVAALTVSKELRTRWLMINFAITYVIVTRPTFQLLMYILPLLPIGVLLMGRAAVQLYDRIASGALRVVWAAGVGMVLIWTTLYSSAYVGLFHRTDVRHQASEWISSHISKGRTIGIAKSYFWTPAVIRNQPSPYRVVGGVAPDTNMVDSLPTLPGLRPDYFVLSDFETREFLRNDQVYAAQAKALRDISATYHSVARFETSPAVGPLTWPKRWVPWDWMYPYPTIDVLERNDLFAPQKPS